MPVGGTATPAVVVPTGLATLAAVVRTRSPRRVVVVVVVSTGLATLAAIIVAVARGRPGGGAELTVRLQKEGQSLLVVGLGSRTWQSIETIRPAPRTSSVTTSMPMASTFASMASTFASMAATLDTVARAMTIESFAMSIAVVYTSTGRPESWFDVDAADDKECERVNNPYFVAGLPNG